MPLESFIRGIELQWSFRACNTKPQFLYRHGYPIAFLDRQILLEILYKHLADGDRRVHTNKRVEKVEHSSDKVRVYCTDQSVFEGDIVVGADGVRSTVRREMWRYMDSIALGKQAAEERARESSLFSP
jgi:2-polyprenyl-6-methoxyphenol hydroxylase-like FAD-dependent oxidoreductase